MGAIQLKLHAFPALTIDTTTGDIQVPAVNGSMNMNDKDKRGTNPQRQLQGYIKK